MLQKAKILNSHIGAEDNFDWQAAWELYNSIYNAEDFDFGQRGVNMSAGSDGIYYFSGYGRSGGGGRGRVANLPSLREPVGVAFDEDNINDILYDPKELGNILWPKIESVFNRVRIYRKYYPTSSEVGKLFPASVNFNLENYKWRSTFQGGAEYPFEKEIEINGRKMLIKGLYRPSTIEDLNYVDKVIYDAHNEDNLKPTVYDYFNKGITYTIILRGHYKESTKDLVILFFSSKQDYILFRQQMIYKID